MNHPLRLRRDTCFKLSTVGIVLLLPLIGCSKKPKPDAQSATASTSATSSTSSSGPKSSVARPQIVFAESAETKERQQIVQAARALLGNKDYAGLEALAAKYRAAKEPNPDGTWKLGYVYEGLEPAGNDSEAAWQSGLSQLQAWMKARPQSATARIAMARAMVSYGWKARGSGYADSVSQASFQTFLSRLQKAAGHLGEARRLNEKCPLYWSTLMKVSLGMQLDKQRYKENFDKAVQEFPDYKYYYNMRATFLLPRWYGEPGEWLKDLTETCDRVGGKSGDLIFAQVFWSLDGYTDSVEVMRKDRAVWERVERGFAALKEQFPDAQSVKAEYAYLASYMGQREKTQNAIIEMKDGVDLVVWEGEKKFQKLLNWAFP